jgi:hypothetical protein
MVGILFDTVASHRMEASQCSILASVQRARGSVLVRVWPDRSRERTRTNQRLKETGYAASSVCISFSFLTPPHLNSIGSGSRTCLCLLFKLIWWLPPITCVRFALAVDGVGRHVAIFLTTKQKGDLNAIHLLITGHLTLFESHSPGARNSNQHVVPTMIILSWGARDGRQFQI